MDEPSAPAVAATPRAHWVARRWPAVTGLIAITLVVALGFLIAARPGGKPLPIDSAWLALLNRNRTDAWNTAAQVLDALGGGLVASLIIPGLVMVLLLLSHRRWGAGYVLIATVLAGASVQILKQHFARDRPANELANLDFGSFPSGHVANAAVLATVLGLLFPRAWVWAAGVVYTVLMMLSRTYLGAHWLSDTVGAVLLAAGVATLVWAPLAAKIAGERVLAADRPPVMVTLWNRVGWLLIEHRDRAPGARQRLVLTAIVVAGAGAAVLLALVFSVLGGSGLTVLDAPVQSLMLDWRSPPLTAVMIGLAIVFGPIALPIIVLVVAVVWGVLGRHAWRPLVLVMGMATGVVVGQIIGRAVDRQRPPIDLMLFGADASFSFPSGHVLGAADFVLITTYLVLSRRPGRRATLIGSAAVAVGIILAAVSRLYLGYHWVTDVLASVALSLIVLGCVIAVDVWWGGRLQSGPPGAGEAIHSIGDEADADRA